MFFNFWFWQFLCKTIIFSEPHYYEKSKNIDILILSSIFFYKIQLCDNFWCKIFGPISNTSIFWIFSINNGGYLCLPYLALRLTRHCFQQLALVDHLFIWDSLAVNNIMKNTRRMLKIMHVTTEVPCCSIFESHRLRTMMIFLVYPEELAGKQL